MGFGGYWEKNQGGRGRETSKNDNVAEIVWQIDRPNANLLTGRRTSYEAGK